jgi:hypothetical protein
MNADYKNSLPLITAEAAIGTAKDILDDKVAQLGFAPNMYQALAIRQGISVLTFMATMLFEKALGFHPKNRN